MSNIKLLLMVLILLTPQIVSANSILINNGDAYTNNSNVSVNISSNLSNMYVKCNTSWINVSTNELFYCNLSVGDGNKTIQIDDNRNSDPEFINSSSIILDTVKPKIIPIFPVGSYTEIEIYGKTYNYTILDNNTNISNTTITPAVLNTTIGNHSYTIKTTDLAGNFNSTTVNYQVTAIPKSTGNVSRSTLKDWIIPNENLTVTLTAIGDAFKPNSSVTIFYVNETIPDEFIVTNITEDYSFTKIGNIYNFYGLGSSLSYNITSTATSCYPYNITGIFMDAYRATGDVEGQKTIRVLNPDSVWIKQWDANSNNYMELNELVNSIVFGFFNGPLLMSQILTIIGYYFSHTSIGC